MRCAKIGGHIVASPDQDDMDERQSRQCAEYCTHRQVVPD